MSSTVSSSSNAQRSSFDPPDETAQASAAAKTVAATAKTSAQSAQKPGGNQVVSNGPSASIPREPAPISTGTLDYYQRRHDDFQARNPGATPPDYYLDYGMKYLKAFSALGHAELSPQGLAWRDAARAGLQRAIEELRAKDPEKFAALERDPEAFRRFAFDSHVKAYFDAGLLELPAQDLEKILLTPDAKDLLSAGGLRQVWGMLQKVRPELVAKIGESTIDVLLLRYSRATDGLTDTVSGFRDGAGKAVEALIDRAGVQRFLTGD